MESKCPRASKSTILLIFRQLDNRLSIESIRVSEIDAIMAGLSWNSFVEYLILLTKTQLKFNKTIISMCQNNYTN